MYLTTPSELIRPTIPSCWQKPVNTTGSQFNAGGGFQDADPTFAGAQVGQTFTASQGTHTEVSDQLRHKVTLRLNRELTNPAAGLLTGGLSQDVATVSR